jgi:hypothetical protein
VALSSSKLNIRINGAARQHNIYTAASDIILPQKAFNVGPDKMIALYPHFSDPAESNRIYIRAGGKNYRLLQANDVFAPALTATGAIPFGNIGAIAGGFVSSGDYPIWMFVGYKYFNTNPNPGEYQCFVAAPGSGLSWQKQNNPHNAKQPGIPPQLVFFNGRFYCLANGRVAYSHDGGSVWTYYNPPPLASGEVVAMGVNNDPIARCIYFVGASSADATQFALAVVGPDGSYSSRNIAPHGSTVDTPRLYFWKNHLYVSWNAGTSPDFICVHFNMNSNPPQKVGYTNPPINGSTLRAYGDSLYATDIYGTTGMVSTDGQNFSSGVLFPITNTRNTVRPNTGNLFKKLAISATTGNRWIAYDYLNGSAPVTILTGANNIQDIANYGYDYILAIEHDGTYSDVFRLREFRRA